MTAEQISNGTPEGIRHATEIIARQLAAGLTVDQIQEQGNDMAAWMFSYVTTDDGRRFAAAYAETLDAAVIDLREQERGSRPASEMADGTPHPDRQGWQVMGGVYVRSPQPDREAAA